VNSRNFLLVLNMGDILLVIMTKVTLTFGFILVISLFTVGTTAGILQNAEAAGPSSRTPDSETVCRSGQVLVYHFNQRDFICTSDTGAAQWVRHGIAEIASEPSADPELERLDRADFSKMSDEVVRMNEIQDLLELSESGERLSHSQQRMLDRVQQFVNSQQTLEEYWGSQSDFVSTRDPTQTTSTEMRTISQTLTSMDDPSPGHENHEIMVILPPSEKTFVGRVTFAASEPVQYVSLIGPLGPGENNGQQTWSPDGGETWYALVIVDQGSAAGGWRFAGNALALHTMSSEPFTATVTVAYVELEPGVYNRGTVKSGTIQSAPDPAMGHESHSLAIILPPREIPYQGGTLAYSASENVQLVALHGPLAPGQDVGQPTWSLDDGTTYALTLVDTIGTNGVWGTFSGNALALHSMNPDGFTASYAVGGLH